MPKSVYIPSIFISGSADWGMYQKPGDLEKMENIFLKIIMVDLYKTAGMGSARTT